MKPYVYIIQNIEKTHWYVGYKQKPKAGEDYWGSSKYLKALIKQTGKENWTKTIISEFDDKDIAHEFEQMLIELMWDLPGRVNKAKNGYVDHCDPEVKAKVTSANQKLAQSPVWRANQKAGSQKRSEDPVWKANLKAGCKNGAKKRAKPFIATNIATGEEFYCESGYCDQAKKLELRQGAVSECLNGKSKQHKGFTFRYV